MRSSPAFFVAMVVAVLAFDAGEAHTPSADIESERDPSGAWVLNPALSDLGGLAGIGRDELLPGGAIDILRRCLEAPEQLVLRLTDASVTFYQNDGSRRVYPISGARIKEEILDLPLETRAAWTGSALRLERKARGGVSITELYAVDPETNRLTVTAAARARRASLPGRIRRVYDSVTAR